MKLWNAFLVADANSAPLPFWQRSEVSWHAPIIPLLYRSTFVFGLGVFTAIVKGAASSAARRHNVRPIDGQR